MAAVERGCLALADITGYTKYVSGVELEHSQDVLADLVGTVVNQMRGLLHLAKLEGDAVFCFSHAGEVDGSTLLSMIESSYFAFAHRLQTIDRHTTCQCNACRLIPRLNLKFMTHHGEYIIHEVAGSRELMGRDVIVAHRLLKNSVTEKTSLRGYALFTRTCLQQFALDPQMLGMTEHTEQYDDVGEVGGYILNLEARWDEEKARRAVYIAPGQGLDFGEIDLPASPPIVWDHLTSPMKRPLWQHDTLRVEQNNPRGVAGVGTTNHCVHGEFVVDEEIVDWKPFRYFTEHSKTLMGSALMTFELTPVGSGDDTRLSCRILPDGGEEGMRAMQAFLPDFRALIHISVEGLAKLLSGVQAESAERATTLTD